MSTIKDVALKAGVTTTTVSRTLNNRGYISDQTRKKVYAAMEELNYKPNELARSLLKRRTCMIGVIVPSIVHPFFAQVVHDIELSASRQGYKTLLCNSQRREELELEYIQMLRSHQVDGIIICSRTSELFKPFEEGFPVVSIERSLSEHIPAVLCDNLEGGVLAARELIAAGCKHPIVISGSKDVQLPADLRAEGFIKECEAQGVPYRVFGTMEVDFEQQDYVGQIRSILKQAPETDGVFATSDVMAAQTIQICLSLDKAVPEDIKVIGFDDSMISRLTTPPLTTIHQMTDKMCEYAVDYIVRQSNGEVVPKMTILPATIVKRGSTKPDNNA